MVQLLRRLWYAIRQRRYEADLVDVSLTDPVTSIMAAAILTVAAALGCFIPARRATKVDPLIALRFD